MNSRLILTITGIIGLFLSVLPVLLFWDALHGRYAYNIEPNRMIAGIELALGILIFCWFLFVVIWAQRGHK